ncbi:hypothetical protein P3W45_000125 [Vairimorpha bombi]|jgi:vesicle transport protein SEC22
MTIYYTLIRENNTKKLISAEFSPQSSNTSISKEILKELRDTKTNGDLNKIESSNSKYLFLIYIYKEYNFSVIIDQYESDQNVVNYVQCLYKELANKKDRKNYEFDTVIKEKSDEFNKDKTMRVVDETKNILADSLNLIIQRRENIDNLSKLANKLSVETKHMHSSIKNMKFKNLMSEYGIYLGIFIIIFLFLYYILH